MIRTEPPCTCRTAMRARITASVPNKIGEAIFSSARIWLARRILSSSPSGNTIRRGCREFHLIIDGSCAHVERASKDERKAEDVIHLVGVVRPASSYDGVRPGRLCLLVSNFGIGIGQREDNWVFGHASHHFGRHAIA